MITFIEKANVGFFGGVLQKNKINSTLKTDFFVFALHNILAQYYM